MDPAKNSTIQRNRRLALTMVRMSNASSVFAGDFEFCPPELYRPNSRYFGAVRRARAQDHQLIVYLFDLHGRAYVGAWSDDREDPGLAFFVENEGGVLHLEGPILEPNYGGLESDSVRSLLSEDDSRRLV